MNKIAPLIQKMIAYNHGDAKRISHALKVHKYAKTIAILEKVNEYDLFKPQIKGKETFKRILIKRRERQR